MFENVKVLDTETNSDNAKIAEIAQLAIGYYNGENWIVESKYYDTVEPMPFGASAVNHISRKMIAGKPKFLEEAEEDVMFLGSPGYFVAHHSPYDKKVITNAFAKLGFTFEDKFICTLRLAKKLFPDLEAHNLSYLRYALDLPIDDSITAHNATDDVLVTIELFKFLFETAKTRGLINSVDELYQFCWESIAVTTMPFGKHKGQAFKEVPNSYYVWLIDNSEVFDTDSDRYDPDLANAITEELNSR